MTNPATQRDERSEERSSSPVTGSETPLKSEPRADGRTPGGGGVGGEKAMRLVVKLYDARNYVRRMTTPEEYRRRIGEYQGYIRQACAKWKLSEIEAMMQLAKKVEHEPIVQAGLFAAYVEMIEPSEGLGAVGDSAPDRERKSPNDASELLAPRQMRSEKEGA